MFLVNYIFKFRGRKKISSLCIKKNTLNFDFNKTLINFEVTYIKLIKMHVLRLF